MIAQLRRAKIDAGEVGSLQTCIAQVGAGHVGIDEVAFLQVGAGQIGEDEMPRSVISSRLAFLFRSTFQLRHTPSPTASLTVLTPSSSHLCADTMRTFHGIGEAHR